MKPIFLAIVFFAIFIMSSCEPATVGVTVTPGPYYGSHPYYNPRPYYNPYYYRNSRPWGRPHHRSYYYR